MKNFIYFFLVAYLTIMTIIWLIMGKVMVAEIYLALFLMSIFMKRCYDNIMSRIDILEDIAEGEE